MRWDFKTYAPIMIALLGSGQLLAQTHSFQVWSDAVLNKPVGKQWDWENTLTYRTNTESSDKWRTFQGQSTMIMKASKQFEFMGFLLVNYTDQTTTYNTMEIRPGLGIHYIPIRNPRFRLAGLLRYESRSFYVFDSAYWKHDDRFRFRIEASYVLKGNNFQETGSLYALTDVEFFYTVDHELDERYGSRIRFRAGLGHPFSSLFKLELIYAHQLSRNSIQKSIVSSQQDIFWLRALFALK